MEMIVISKKRFDELLEITRNKIQLTRYEKVIQSNINHPEILAQDMARIFNYEFITFANKLREG